MQCGAVWRSGRSDFTGMGRGVVVCHREIMWFLRCANCVWIFEIFQ